jgi:thymidylate synthase (FAD)
MDLSDEDLQNLKQHLVTGAALYDDLIKKGAAKECARMILPLCTQTTMYMTGNLRSWIHYVDLRSGEDTQLEHREIAISIKDILIDLFPNTSEALNWKKSVDL